MPSAHKYMTMSCSVLAKEALRTDVLARTSHPLQDAAYWQTFNPLLFP